nr:hypothetical protein [Deferribacter autotrophicus]
MKKDSMVDNIIVFALKLASPFMVEARTKFTVAEGVAKRIIIILLLRSIGIFIIKIMIKPINGKKINLNKELIIDNFKEDFNLSKLILAPMAKRASGSVAEELIFKNLSMDNGILILKKEKIIPIIHPIAKGLNIICLKIFDKFFLVELNMVRDIIDKKFTNGTMNAM